jgi:putative transposase
MRPQKFNDTKIIKILKEAEAGLAINDLCRKYGIGRTTYYHWKNRYTDMEVSDIKRLKELKSENERLKKMFTEMALENHALKDLIEKKL